jgi:hypothetical protein
MARSKDDFGVFDMASSYRCVVTRRRSCRLVGLAMTLVAAGTPGSAQTPAAGTVSSRAPVSAEELIRAVARAQRRADLAVTASTFDQVEVRTDFGKDGRPRSTRRRRYQYFSGDEPDRATRELVEVDGRPATGKERREEAEDDEKLRRKRVEREVEARASRPPGAHAAEEDPLIGARRLSDLIARFSYGPVEEVLVQGRPAYALDFSPKPGLRAATLGDRALNSLAGRVVVDATDHQVVSVEARLVAPVRVGMGLGANVRSATISYQAQRLSEGAWLPCVVELRLTGRVALLLRLDSSYRFEFSGYARYSVEVETDVGGRSGSSVQSAP